MYMQTQRPVAGVCVLTVIVATRQSYPIAFNAVGSFAAAAAACANHDMPYSDDASWHVLSDF